MFGNFKFQGHSTIFEKFDDGIYRLYPAYFNGFWMFCFWGILNYKKFANLGNQVQNSND